MSWTIIGKDDPAVVQGGLNRYVFGLAAAMDSLGEQVCLIVSGRAVHGMVDAGVTGNSVVRVMRFFVKGYALQADRAHVVNVHFAMYGAPFLAGLELRRVLDSMLLKRVHRPTVIYNFHGPWADESMVAQGTRLLAHRLKRGMENFCLKRADRIVVLSREFATKVVATFGVSPENVRRIPPGVEDQWFASGGTFRTSTLQPLRLVCVRRLTSRMGHLELLDALEELSFVVGDAPVELHIVGRGETQERIQQWVADHGREESVFLHGFLSDQELLVLMRKCQGAVVPTTQLEGFGLVVLEAMAMGLPVISTGQGGLSEAMGPWGREPYVFNLDNPKTLMRSLEAVCEMSRDPESFATLVEYAKGHSWTATAGSIRSVALEVSS